MSHSHPLSQKIVIMLAAFFSLSIESSVFASDTQDENLYGKKVNSGALKQTIFNEIFQSFPDATGTHWKIVQNLDFIKEATAGGHSVYANWVCFEVYKQLGDTLFERALNFVTATRQPGASVQSLQVAAGSHFTDSNLDIEQFNGETVYLKMGPIVIPPQSISTLVFAYYFEPAQHYLRKALGYSADQRVKDRLAWVEKSFAALFPKKKK